MHTFSLVQPESEPVLAVVVWLAFACTDVRARCWCVGVCRASEDFVFLETEVVSVNRDAVTINEPPIV